MADSSSVEFEDSDVIEIIPVEEYDSQRVSTDQSQRAKWYNLQDKLSYSVHSKALPKLNSELVSKPTRTLSLIKLNLMSFRLVMSENGKSRVRLFTHVFIMCVLLLSVLFVCSGSFMLVLLPNYQQQMLMKCFILQAK